MLLKRTRNQAQICRPVKPITCADSSRVGYDEKRAERRRNFEGWGQENGACYTNAFSRIKLSRKREWILFCNGYDYSNSLIWRYFLRGIIEEYVSLLNLLKGRGGGRQYKIGREDKVDKMEKRRTEGGKEMEEGTRARNKQKRKILYN